MLKYFHFPSLIRKLALSTAFRCIHFAVACCWFADIHGQMPAAITDDSKHPTASFEDARVIAGSSLVSFVSADVRYSKTAAPAISVAQTEWNTKAWRGEKVHTKFLIRTTDAIDKVSITVGDLKTSSGNKIA